MTDYSILDRSIIQYTLQTVPLNRPIGIYGAGRGGQILRQYLQEIGVEVEVFFDKDRKLQKQSLNGVKVVDPKNICTSTELFLMVANGHYEDVSIELMSKGWRCSIDYVNVLTKAHLNPTSIYSRLGELFNIAVCISGQMRSDRYTYKSILENVVNPLNADVFIHTWSVSGSTPKKPDMDGVKESAFGRYHKPTREEYGNLEITTEELQELFNPKRVVIESFFESMSSKILDVFLPPSLAKFDPLRSPACLPQSYKIWACNQLKLAEENDRQFKYDFVIRLRPDLAVYEPLPLKIFENPNKLWWCTWPNLGTHQVSDKLAISNSKIMDSYSSLYPRLNSLWRDPLGDGEPNHVMIGERLMARHVRTMDLDEGKFDLNCEIVR